MTQGPFKPVPIKVVRREAGFDQLRPEIHEHVRQATLKHCLVESAEVLKPNNMYFLEITDTVQAADSVTPFATYVVSIRIWEKPDGNNTSNTDQGK